jgi:Arc/MetJ family transcription regulator
VLVPRRKFPCKHALGLLLLLADGAVPEGEPAEWTVQWRDKRAQRAERRATEPVDKEARAKAAAKRAASRESKVDSGVEALQQWPGRLVPYTARCRVVYVSRTNIDIDDEVIARVQRTYGLRTKREAVDFALRRLLVEPMSRDEALAMEGAGWPGDLNELREAGRPRL